MGKKPYTRICDRCGHRKPWRRGYHPPGEPPRFVCEECCLDAGGAWGSKAGWRFPVPDNDLRKTGENSSNPRLTATDISV